MTRSSFISTAVFAGLAAAVVSAGVAQQLAEPPAREADSRKADPPKTSPSAAAEQRHPSAPLHDDPPYYDIGAFHQPVETGSEEAQLWFDRGLAMCFAFNHEEAVRCFERAYASDPTLAMALWGMAYAWGPYINNPELPPEQSARAALAVKLGQLTADTNTGLENDLLAALAARYASHDVDRRAELDKNYADALREVYRRRQDDPLVAALFAESLMNLRPWKYWSPDGTPAPETPEIVAVIESALEKSPEHPFLCHLYIHAMEASPTPEKALPAADRLRDSLPGLGHLRHMPSHIDVRVGDYARVIEANQKGIDADAEFLKREGPNNFYSFYRMHNYHFLTYGAMFDGQYKLAINAAREMPRAIPEAMLRAEVDSLDAFMPTPLHVLIRFGRWEDVLAEPAPADYLPMSRAMHHYARGVAYAATGRVAEAEREKKEFDEARAAVPETSMLFNNTSASILGVADKMLAGEIAYRAGNADAAFRLLEEAVGLDDALNYDEPWGWMQPARHALGALLLEQNRYAEAEAVYRADLQRHPHNVWALQGLVESLEKLGRADEAAAVRQEYEKAAARCDIKVDRSCFCRTK